MDEKSFEKLELNKILQSVSDFAVLECGKQNVLNLKPQEELLKIRRELDLTEECDKLLFSCGIEKVPYFEEIGDIPLRAAKGSILSCGELLCVAALLGSAEKVYNAISRVNDDKIVLIKEIANKLCFDENLTLDITGKIIPPASVADNASSKLFEIRSKIRNLNERIRSKLSEYISGDFSDYLQDSIVTIRNDRYVVPVKAEYKNKVKGFVHDRSKTGATFFIEPEYVLELNNELVALSLDEQEEVEAILRELSNRVGALSDEILRDNAILGQIDCCFARAEYAYSLKCCKPKVNDRGYINIIKGRHPLIDKNSVVPVSVELGSGYNFLLLSGANTGGKTVTLKMCGLFCLMAACGLFIPAVEGSSVAVFDGVYCDIGDRQSIEESLSTFSSHITNIIDICNKADDKSLVLIDELGGGTNPDEGQALAKAVLKHLLEAGCKGIITTHFTPLKEYAYAVDGVENASMEFDSATLKPLYSIKIGLPGASNALAISRRLGMDKGILEDAESFLSEGAKSFENVVRRAEESRVEAECTLSSVREKEREMQQKLSELDKKLEEVEREKERISRTARQESKRIVSERTERAEEMLSEIEKIFKEKEITESQLIKARTIKNNLKDVAYEEENDEKPRQKSYPAATKDNIKVGVTVFIKPMQTKGVVLSVSEKKGEAEVMCGSIKTHLKFSDLLFVGEQEVEKKQFKFKKTMPKEQPILEISVLGMTVGEALYEVDNFIDRAVTDNLAEIKIIHGVGTGRLRAAIADHLKRHRNVESFRLGKYGEGETGVTFVKLK